jgi:MFS family permease
MTSYREVMRWNYMKPVLFCFLVTTLRICTGFGSVVAFTYDVFAESGGSIDAYTAVIVSNALQFVASVVGTRMFDWIGRRKTALISASLMTIGDDRLSLNSMSKMLHHI